MALIDQQDSIETPPTTLSTSTNATTPGSRNETQNDSDDNASNNTNKDQNGGNSDDNGGNNDINDGNNTLNQELAGGSSIPGPSNPLSSNKGTRCKQPNRATGKKVSGK